MLANRSLQGPFDVGPGGQSEVTIRRAIYFGESQSLITLHPFTITNTNCTPTVSNVGTSPRGRPCANFAGAGASTDGSNFAFGVAGILLQAGKAARARFSYFSADIANHEMAFGFGVVGTGMIASDPTDYVMLRFTTGQTVPHLRCKKANANGQDVALNISAVETAGALVSSIWYDFEFEVTPDPVVSGAGRIRVWLGRNGGAKVLIYDDAFGAGIPDTVKMAPFVSGRAGGAVTTIWSWGEYEYELAS